MLRYTGSLVYLIPTMDGQTVEAEDFVKHHWDHFFAQALCHVLKYRRHEPAAN